MNALDPIVSTGLPESILKNKKETSRPRMVLCKGKKRASKNNPYPKLLRFLGLHFNLLGEQNFPRIFKHNSNGVKYSNPVNLIEIGEIVRQRNLFNNVSLFAL